MSHRGIPTALAAACALLLLSASCENANVDHRHPKISHDVVLRPERPAFGVGIELGSQLRLQLPVPPPAYVWDIVSNNVRVLEQTSPLRQASAGKSPGSLEAPVVTFYALKPGRSVVRFALLHPTEQDAIPSEHFELTVVVKDEE